MSQLNKISVPEFISMRSLSNNILTIDIRQTQDFIEGFIPESLHVPISRLEKYLPIISGDHKIIVVSYGSLSQEETEALSSIKEFPVWGYLDSGIAGWQANDEELDLIIDIDPEEFLLDYKFDDHFLLLDVRDENKFHEEHISGALNFPVKNLNDIIYLADIDTDKNIYIHCGGGSGSVFTASYFKKQGIHNVYIISCGYKCLKDTGELTIITPAKTT